jgi:hypothetical protein
VRRVVIFLLALVLAPSIATAARYRCTYDQVVRSECCCPAVARHGEAPEPIAAVRAACCCTILEGAPAVRATWADPTPLELHAFVVPAVVTIAKVAAPTIASPVVDRPRVQRAPPDSLFARFCSLLL